MLEPCVNQASGLLGLAAQTSPRLVAMASHGDQKGELPMLWGLCAAWVEMGLPVVVLDGHTCETAENPGLFQLLDDNQTLLSERTSPVSWSVVPAAAGLRRLSATGFCDRGVVDLFKHYSVVLLYTSPSNMNQLLKGSDLAPLLVVPPLKSSALTAYQALKQLLIDGQFHPTVANILPESTTIMSAPTSLPAQIMMDCATNFLGYQIKPLTITASAKAERSQEDINRLALQLLENGLFLERHPTERVH